MPAFAVSEDGGHALPATCATRPLPIIAGARRHVPHQHHVQSANIHAQLQGWRCHQAVQVSILPFKLPLNAGPLLCRDLGGMLRWNNGFERWLQEQGHIEIVLVECFQLELALAVVTGALVARG